MISFGAITHLFMNPNKLLCYFMRPTKRPCPFYFPLSISSTVLRITSFGKSIKAGNTKIGVHLTSLRNK